MEIYISINGVLRNLIQKINYHYNDGYILADNIGDDDVFEYGIIEPIRNDNLLESYKFQSKQQFDYFLHVEYVLEIFGHAGLSHDHAISNLNNLIFENREHNFTLVGIDELGKSKPATLFFLSKNGFMGDNIKFAKSEDIDKLWGDCDYWITDDKKIIDKCPKEKFAIKFNTPYNQHFTNNKEISKLNEIQELCFKSLEKITTSTSTEL
jgi:hypothetical protein